MPPRKTPPRRSPVRAATATGPIIAAGFEYAINKTVSLALEYNYIHLNDADYELGASTGTYRWRIDVPDIHWIAVRLNYRFN
jgi:opacity protein-like surface antigen